MRLRTQLSLLAIVALALPWAGAQYARELESALRAGQEQALKSAAGALAGVLTSEADRLATAGNGGDSLFVHRLERAPVLDGFASDWDLPDDAPQPLPDGASRLTVASTASHLYLFVQAVDATVLHRGPDVPQGDRVVVRTDDGDETRRWVFAPEAPGAFTPRRASANWRADGQAEPRILAHWQPRPDGYQVEIRIPHALVGDRLGAGFIDVDDPGAAPERRVLTWSPGRTTGRLVGPDDVLAERLARNLPPGVRGTLLDAENWPVARGGALATPAQPSFDDTASLGVAFRDRLYTWWLGSTPPPRPDNPRGGVRLAGEEISAARRDGVAVAARYHGEDATVVSVAAPVGDAVLVLEQGSAEIVTLTNRTLTRILTLALGVTGVLGLVLFGYASWLSWRVGRLSRAAAAALGPRGQIDTRLPGTRRGDELGDLARSFQRLLGAVAGYTGYLRTLGGKLSHELRTPLAVVRSSLESIDPGAPPAEQAAYLERARGGAERLRDILARLSEATQAEEMVRSSPRSRYDPRPVLTACVEAYADLHPDHRLRLDDDDTPVALEGAGELLAQALDKLVDNAVAFTPAGGQIVVRLRSDGREARIEVENDGSRLPDEGIDLFDSLVSVRATRGDAPHLGLGLYVVRLVAEFHGGRAQARNTARGVAVELRLPAARG